MKSPGRQFKDAIYEQFSRIGKAVSSPKRLELLDLICQGEKTVETLSRETGLSVANTSQHLQTLKTARLISSEKDGTYVKYRPADETVCEFFRFIRLLAEDRLAEVNMIKRRFLKGMEPVNRDDLLKRVVKGDVTVLDVRPVEEYRAGHIPGALSVPLGQLKSKLVNLPADQEIVAYCRGPYCVLAIQAVKVLRGKGFNAIRLEESVQDWRAIGLPVEVGD
jgi:rhodanese-related sulfurtransferase